MADDALNAPSFLGRGWSFPPEFVQASGDVVMTEEQADIDASLRVLFGTAAGERFLVPTYGLDLHELQFEPVSTSMRTFLQDRIKTSILVHEPRITLLSLEVRNPTEADGMLLIVVEYAIRATNSRFNLVYPFYWNDATEVAMPTGGR
ncbi:MAG TPA: GPW/gp25 family protein [Vicinamibacterales bacterium]|nr:GPW/gp25 family protein [Vicinamibacterales bacterium]